ncbi:70ce7523-c243-47da-943b-3bcfba5dca22 [Sclerotinia trifoliorum]|uniref:70ce7523-c243-47da-943b-3bcfba5dca22 n=1 Tax=Sclerotinia trifoliorum TaxID=28548 RepID=A0A8H2VSW0_9HELO|nr:70ce7523-c243-47da-943b-3bcfba5dca22 [Sclerotinia trifoliorum]
MDNQVYYELPAEPVKISAKPQTQSQQQQQQSPSLPPRNPPAPSVEDEESTIRGVPGDNLTATPLPLFVRRSKSNLLSQSSENATTNTTSTTPPDRPNISTTESYETNTSDNSPPLPGKRPNLNIHTGPSLPPRRISQYNPDEIHFTRDSHRVIAYLIPLPKPINVSDGDFPQRYLMYTPPAAHLLKPAEGIKEGKRHKGKRIWQREVKKAKTYDGKTMSFKGLHSKTTRGVLWGINSIKNTDITFLNRVPRKEIEELHIVYPLSIPHSPVDLRSQLLSQLARTKTRAKRHAAISTLLLLPTLLIDTFAAVIWPFGGLFEVDAIWAFTSIRGYLVSRSIIQRLKPQDTLHEALETRTQDRELYLRFQKSEQLSILERYVEELCHKCNPARFESAGVPPTDSQVLKAMGWEPDLRGRVKSGERGGMPEGGVRDWDDERWQEREMREDLLGVLGKGAKSWDAWCKKWEKNPKRAEKK